MPNVIRRRAPFAVVLYALAAYAAGCGDSTAPEAGIRYYRIRSYVTPGGPARFPLGDLLLHADGAYTWGQGSTDPTTAISTGRWMLVAGTLRLVDDVGAVSIEGAVSADSVRFTMSAPSQFPGTTSQFVATYAEATPPSPGTESGQWVLRAVDGATAVAGSGIPVRSPGANGAAPGQRVLYDTLTFTDGVFMRERLAILDSTYTLPGNVITPYTLAVAGRYGRSETGVIFRSYTGFAAAYDDSLTIRGDTLVRSRLPFQDRHDERYVRVR